MVYSFYFLPVGSRRNECNSLWEELRGGERSEVYCYPESMPATIFTCSHITFVMVYSFYFLLVGSRRNEFNSLWEELRGRISKVFCLLGRYLVRREKMIYCDNIMINLSCKVIACGIILSSVKLEKKVQHSENDIRISHNLLSPSPSFSKDYCIHSFWSQNTEKRNTAISQMRLRSKQ